MKRQTNSKFIIVILILFILVLSGCRSAATEAAQATAKPTENAEPSATLEPTLTSTMKETVEPINTIIATRTAKPIVTPIPEPMTDCCIEISENQVSFSQLNGGLVLNGCGGGKTGNLAAILNFETGELKHLVSNELDGSVAIAVSPDNELVLVVKRPANEGYMRKIALLDGNAQLVKEIPLEAEWGMESWLNNDYIVVYGDWPDKPYEW